MGVVLGENLAQIRLDVLKKSKDTDIINIFFHNLHGEYLLKQKAVVVKILEWKFKANIARNVSFEDV